MILPKSILEARRLIKNFKPEVVVGAGGYVSGPVLLMASLMRVPTLVMDSNALPGFTNRRLAPFVTKAALTFEEAVPFFGKKGIVTGNPVRREFFDIPPKGRNSEKFSLLIFGGSQGARAINNALVEALTHLQAYKNKLQITHQTGEADFEKIKLGYADADWREAEVSAYIKNMPEHFEKNDLIICRAGATSCAELAAAGKASIMIPLPTAADDHQRKNAEALEKAGAARMILQKDLTGAGLAKQIIELIDSPARITEMEASAKKLAKRDAAEVTADLIEELARRN
jgi:UDP-N-acetylglucosamine--N-acetylmuramyl-(pentapeptide) pyrophosphoryl-undecaprenol N-acetylglucosamine transferase